MVLICKSSCLEFHKTPKTLSTIGSAKSKLTSFGVNSDIGNICTNSESFDDHLVKYNSQFSKILYTLLDVDIASSKELNESNFSMKEFTTFASISLFVL